MVIDYKKLKSQISRDSLGCNLFSATNEQKMDDVDSIARVCSKREFMRTMEHFIHRFDEYRRNFTK